MYVRMYVRLYAEKHEHTHVSAHSPLPLHLHKRVYTYIYIHINVIAHVQMHADVLCSWLPGTTSASTASSLRWPRSGTSTRRHARCEDDPSVLCVAVLHIIISGLYAGRYDSHLTSILVSK